MQDLVSGCHVIIHKFPIGLLPKYMNALAVLEIEDEKVGLVGNDFLTCS